MRINRFFVENITEKIGDGTGSESGKSESKNSTHFSIGKEMLWLVHQIKNVLKLHAGEKVVVFDEKTNYTCLIERVEKDEIFLLVEDRSSAPSRIWSSTLFQAILKKDALDLVVQKNTELEVGNIVLFTSERSVLREVSVANIDRMKKIAIEAVEQSRGNHIPDISFMKSFDLARYDFSTFDMVIFADSDGQRLSDKSFQAKFLSKIGEIKGAGGKIAYIIGPEGGWTDTEKNNQFMKLSLGENILRAPTAGIVVAGYLLL